MTRPRSTGWWLVGLLVLFTLGEAAGQGFGSDSPMVAPRHVSPEVLAPAPRDCLFPPLRADILARGAVLALLRGHVPRSLPQGFGVLVAWNAGGLEGSGVIWSDAKCREVTLVFQLGARLGADPGPRVGPWMVIVNTLTGCGLAVLGPSPCLQYEAEAQARDGVLSLELMGFDREDGDRVALAIIL